MYVLHSYEKMVSLLDAEGRTYRIPPNEAWEVPSITGTDIPGPIGQPAYKSFTTSSDQVGKMLIKQGIYYGLVECQQIKVNGGIKFDEEGARKASTVARTQAEDALLKAYVKSAKEDELAKLPIRPPSAPIQKILNERKLDLKRDFGVQPVGWVLSDGAKARDEEMASLKDQMREMKEAMQLLIENQKLKKA